MGSNSTWREARLERLLFAMGCEWTKKSYDLMGPFEVISFELKLLKRETPRHLIQTACEILVLTWLFSDVFVMYSL
jgi:hypothetical protein